MHILWIPSWYPTAEDPIMGIFFKEQAIALMEEGHQVGVIYPEMRPLKQLAWSLAKKNRFQITHAVEDGLPTYRLHGWNLFPKMEQIKRQVWIKNSFKLAKKYFKDYGQPDLIHAHSTFWGGMAAHAISKKFSIPYVVTEHQDVFLHGKIFSKDFSSCWTKPYINDTLNKASGVIAVSQQLMNCLQSFMHEQPIVIPNSVDTHFFSLPATRPEAKPFRFLTVANLIPIKNIELLLRSFQKVREKDPSICLEIVGDGEERARLEAISAQLGLTQSVIFSGKMIERSLVRKAFHRAHAFVLPSNFETFGVVLIEALSTGLPVIATKAGGPQDIVSEKVGKLISPGNAEELSQAMLYIRHTPYDSNTIRQHAVHLFDKKKVAASLVTEYQRALLNPK